MSELKTAKCGCVYSAIQMCPLHAAAPDMLAALRTTESEIVTARARLVGAVAQNMDALLDVVRAAIVKAGWNAA